MKIPIKPKHTAIKNKNNPVPATNKVPNEYSSSKALVNPLHLKRSKRHCKPHVLR